MSPLSADRNAPYKGADIVVLPVQAGEKIYAGGLVALQAGYAVAGQEAGDLVAVGRAEEQVDNTNGGDGDVEVEVLRNRLFKFKNSAGDPVAQADVGNDVYIEDDETVSKTDNLAARSVAGKLFGVDADGVWVLI